MALANIYRGYINIPSTKQPITLNFTGAATVNVNCYYDIVSNTVSLYIPFFNVIATSNGLLTANLPLNLTPIHDFSFIGSTINSTGPGFSSETQGIITISTSGVITISRDITYDQFTQGNQCGVYTGKTLIYNLN